MGEWKPLHEPVARTFPGPVDARAELRVAMVRSAYADYVGHTKESLDAEVCGVLVGDFCEDDEGLFVYIVAALRGAGSQGGRSHVTFTHATWDAIHGQMDKEYPDHHIVGWYHSHPGFGVEFSEMDRFIQRNFFPSPAQIALVTDPLGGQEAILLNMPDGGMDYIDRFWVDGREKACFVPRTADNDGLGSAALEGLRKDLEKLETRLTQVLRAMDEQRASSHRLILGLAFVLIIGVILFFGQSVYRQLNASLKPPEVNQYIPIPIRIGDETILMGVGVVEWEVPPALNAVYIELEKRRLEAEQEAAKDAGTAVESDGAGSPE